MEIRYAAERKLKKKLEKENENIKKELQELKKALKDMKALEEKRYPYLFLLTPVTLDQKIFIPTLGRRTKEIQQCAEKRKDEIVFVDWSER